MKAKTVISIGLLIIIVCAMTLQSMAGAIRHDVPEEKYKELGNQPQFDNVGLILVDDAPKGSCVLITSRWIITAGHVVNETDKGLVKLRFGNKFYSAKKIIINPNYKKKVLGHVTDLALIYLDHPVKNIKPAKRYIGSEETGLVGTSVGFGVSGAGRKIIKNPSPAGTKRAGKNVIDSISGTIDGRKLPDNLLAADFDYPNDTSQNRIGDSKPLDLEYCPLGGDSGGGLFVKQNEKWFLVGIFSGFTVKIHDDLNMGIYGSLMYWTRVSVNNKWIDKNIK